MKLIFFKRLLHRINVYYILWVLIHYTYRIYVNVHDYLVYLWRQIILKYWTPIFAQYCYNSRLYVKFCHYIYYYYDKNAKNRAAEKCDYLRNFDTCLEDEILLSIIEQTSVYSKTPKHIGFNLLNFGLELEDRTLENIFGNNLHDKKTAAGEESGDLESSLPCELKVVCKLICWSWLAQIHIISLYDYNGILKNYAVQLESAVQKEMQSVLMILKKFQSRLLKKNRNLWIEHAPSIQIVVPSELRDNDMMAPTPIVTNSKHSSSSSETIQIFIFSKADGKQTIVDTAKDLFTRQNPKITKANEGLESVDSAPTPEPEINAEKINSILSHKLYPKIAGAGNQDISSNSCSITDPDVLVISGRLKSTMGFLPWNLRLTQIYWMPEILRIQAEDFTNVLLKYTKSQQRFGT